MQGSQKNLTTGHAQKKPIKHLSASKKRRNTPYYNLFTGYIIIIHCVYFSALAPPPLCSPLTIMRISNDRISLIPKRCMNLDVFDITGVLNLFSPLKGHCSFVSYLPTRARSRKYARKVGIIKFLSISRFFLFFDFFCFSVG